MATASFRLVSVRLILVSGFAMAGPGCIELQALLGLGASAGGGGSQSPDGGDSGGSNGGGDSGDDTGLPIVNLTVSNATPQLDEQVTLTCALVAGSSVGLSFTFDATLPRLTVNDRTGTARFIVDQSDLGVSYSFTCQAANDAGVGPRSRSVLVTPSDVTQP